MPEYLSLFNIKTLLIVVRRLESQESTTNHHKSDQKQISVRKDHVRKKKDEIIRPQVKKIDSVSDYGILPNNQVSIEAMTISGKGPLIDIALFIGIFLLLVHIFLCYKLYFIDQGLHSSDGNCINQCEKGSLFVLVY